MKKYVFLAFFALIAFVVKAQDESGDLVKEGQQMPAFTIVNDNGTQVPSSSLKRKVILVNFFATWCPPCQKELAEVQKMLWPKYKDNKDFVLLVIGRDIQTLNCRSITKRKVLPFPYILIRTGLSMAHLPKI